jgi:hypothetical protein
MKMMESLKDQDPLLLSIEKVLAVELEFRIKKYVFSSGTFSINPEGDSIDVDFHLPFNKSTVDLLFSFEHDSEISINRKANMFFKNGFKS